MEAKNPIDHVRFYAKDSPNEAFKLNKDRVSDSWESIRINNCCVLSYYCAHGYKAIAMYVAILASYICLIKVLSKLKFYL